MSFADIPPEKRREMRAKAQETRNRKKAEKLAAAIPLSPEGEAKVAEIAAEIPPTLADLGLVAETEDDYRIDPDEILTNEEIAAIRAEAKAKVAADRKKAKRKLVLDLAMVEARREAGEIPFDEERERELAEMTTIRINLPRHRLATGRELPPDPIILDQRMFMHGRTYQVTKAVAEYLMDRMARSWEHMAQVDGRTKTYYNEQLGTMMYQGGVASGGGGFGMSFDAIHRRPT